MHTITLNPLLHHSQECMSVGFVFDKQICQTVKSLRDVKWSQTHKSWQLPLNKRHLQLLRSALKTVAVVESTVIEEYLRAKEKSPKLSLLLLPSVSGAGLYTTICKPNFEALLQTEQHLVLKAYSSSTIRTYLGELTLFMKVLKNHAAADLTIERIKDYLQYCLSKLRLSENTLHSRLNALKFFYEQVLGRKSFFWDVPRPKKAQQLPKLLSKEEVARIINCITNKKHKAMITLAYGAGLRVSELTALKTFDIDSHRMTISVRGAKGKKDRIVPLSPVLLIMLREYAGVYRPDGNGYLFEGLVKNQPYNVRSIQKVLQLAKLRAKINKPGSLHVLRHSFATHLIEKGTDVTMIQKILGHHDIKTTLLYLHTTNSDLIKIVSPLDDLTLV